MTSNVSMLELFRKERTARNSNRIADLRSNKLIDSQEFVDWLAATIEISSGKAYICEKYHHSIVVLKSMHVSVRDF